VIEFSSARKAMSIVVRMPDERICIFCKGADSAIVQRLRLSDLAMRKAVEVEQRVSRRQSMEARKVMRRAGEAQSRKNSLNRTSISIHRPSLGGVTRASMTTKRLQPIRDELNHWLTDRESEVIMPPADNESMLHSPRSSAQIGIRQVQSSVDGRASFNDVGTEELVEEYLVVDDAAVFERCFQHINDFATEGLRTLLHGYKYLEEDEYRTWKKIYLDASTSLTNRQEMVEKQVVDAHWR